MPAAMYDSIPREGEESLLEAEGGSRNEDIEFEKEEPPRSPRPDYVHTITVLVGENEKAFTVHKSPICAKSPFFKAACNEKRWVEGREGVIKLPEANPNAFEAILHWVYSGQLRVHSEREPEEEPTPDFATVWNLSNFLGTTDLCNLVIDVMMVRIKRCPKSIPDASSIAKMEPNTMLWQMVVDHVASRIDVPHFQKYYTECSKEFIIDLTVALLSTEYRTTLDPRKKDRCHYHIHKEGGKMCGRLSLP